MSKIYSLLLIIFLFSPFSVSADHVMGAEFEWKEIGKDTFLITVNAYKDCNGNTPLNASAITLISKCGSQQLSTSRSLVGDVTPVCSSIDSRCKSRSSTFDYGIEKYRLTSTFVATTWRNNGYCCEVKMSWTQCCRNGAITTGSSNENFYLEAKMNICTPTSIKWQNDAIGMSCLGQDVSLEQSITTPNSTDSIVYSMAAPLASATTQTSWNSYYDYDVPLWFLGFPKTTSKLPRGFHLDSVYGVLKFRPMKAEITVMAIKAQVYRNGTLIAETIRDIQYMVLKCASNSPPQLSGFDLKTPIPKNFTRTICAEQRSCFDISADDNDSKDSIKLTFNGKIGDSFIINNSNAQYEKGTFCWTPDSSYIGKNYHSFSIIAKDNACPFAGTDTRIYKIKVKKESTIKPELQNRDLHNCGDYFFKVVDKDKQDIENLEWFLNDSISLGKKDSFKHTFTKAGINIIKAQIIDCDTINIYDTINVTSVNNLAVNLKDTALCALETLKLDARATGNYGNITYKWIIDSSFNYVGKLDSSAVLLDLQHVTGTKFDPIILNINDTAGCKLTKEIKVTPKTVSLVNIENNQSICAGDLDTLKLDQYNGEGLWNGTNVNNNKLTFDGLIAGKYLLTFKLEKELSCIIDTAIIGLKDLPKVNAGIDFNTCIGADATTLNATPSKGNWMSGLISSNQLDPTLVGKGKHSFVYLYTDSVGCSNADTLQVEVFDYKPSVSVTDTAEVCESDDVAILKASKSGGNWLGSGVASNSNPLRFSPADFGSGSFEVYYNYTDSNQCSTTETAVVIITEAPLISISIKDTIIRQGDTINIANNTINQNGASFSWSVGNPAFLTSTLTNLKEAIDTVGEFDLMLIAEDASTGCIDTLIEEKAFKVVLGTGFAFSENDFNIYPNPASTILIIDTKMDIEFVSIYSMDGREVKTTNSLNSNTIEVSTLEKGMYLLKIQGESSSFNYTFIKD